MISTLHRKLVEKELSCVELTNLYLEAAQRDNAALNAYVTLTPDTALAAARAADERLARGESLGLLDGIPMTLKDNISTKGIETTCSSRMLQGYRPIYDAAVWEALQAQGSVLLGKTNMDEFAMGSSSETSVFGGSKNPHNLGHVAGGSSGGAASAVAGHLAAFGLGSDTGGSIRQPASFCGIVGLKPTYGAVSRYGLIAYASSLDQIGPLTLTVEDAAAVFDAISGRDERDSTCSGAKEATLPGLKRDIRGLRIGVAKEYFEGIKGDVHTAMEKAMETYRALGAEIEECSLPSLRYALPVYYILACAEASSNLGRYDGIRYGYKTSAAYESIHEMVCKTRSEGFGEEVKRRILLGTYVLSSGYYDAYYKKAQNLRGKIVEEMRAAFDSYDILLAPTVPMTSFPLDFTAHDPVETYLTDICTVPVNIAGLPGISLPCGFDSQNLPIGLQLIGAPFAEAKLLNAAYAYEQAAGLYRPAPFGVQFEGGDRA